MKRKILVIGGSVAGLAVALRAAERGLEVILATPATLIAAIPPFPGEGFNAAGVFVGDDGVEAHERDSIAAGCGLADSAVIRDMCRNAVRWFSFLDRAGLPFDRDAEGLPAVRIGTGAERARLYAAGRETGRLIHHALASQFLRLESEGRATLFEHSDFIAPVLDGRGICRGAVIQDLRGMDFRAVKADAVVITSDAPLALFGSSADILSHGGFAAWRLCREGAIVSNPEFVRFSPLGVRGPDRRHELPAEFLADGARLVAEAGEGFKDILVASSYRGAEAGTMEGVCRIMSEISREAGEGKNQVFLDVGGLPPGPRDATRKFICDRVFGAKGHEQGFIPVEPLAVEFLGGLATDDRGMMMVPGVFAAGGLADSGQGAGALAGDRWPAVLQAGEKVASGACLYAEGLERGCLQVDEAHFIRAVQREEELWRNILDLSGPENVFRLLRETADVARAGLGPSRDKRGLTDALLAFEGLRGRFSKIGLSDRGSWFNQEAVFVRHVEACLEWGRLAAYAALMRTESRGVHSRADFPLADDGRFGRRTLVRWDENCAKVSFEEGQERGMCKTGEEAGLARLAKIR